jgi:hypothetical protein
LYESAAVRVSSGGTLKFIGRLGDGTKISYAAPISSSDTWPLFKALYRGKAGALIGSGTLDSGDWTGLFHWHRPADSRSRSFPNGFEGDLELSASPE